MVPQHPLVALARRLQGILPIDFVGARRQGAGRGDTAPPGPRRWVQPGSPQFVGHEAGHGIALRMTALELAVGDKLDGELDQIGYIRKIAKVGTEESGMFQIRKFGIRRKVAYDFIYEWSRMCNPPEE